jgi:16S rRNA (cytosine967-C5)-methyltransferase
MKLYPNLKTAIITIISNTIEKKMVLDHEIQGLFKKNKQWGARDRRAIAQCSYDIIRHYELLLHLSGSKEQIIETYLEQLNENDFFDFKKIENALKDTIPFEILYSLPIDLLKIFENQKVNEWEANWKAMQQKAPIFLRVNESQAKMDYFTQILDEYQFEYQQISELHYDNLNLKLNAIELNQPIPKNHEIFAINRPQFEIQDIGSQCLSILSNPQDNTKILESCAGNGGKTTHLLDLTKSITLHAMDIEPKKLQHLEQRVQRMFGKKVKTFEATAEEISNHKAWADALYLDVPCSGSGTFRRQADLNYSTCSLFADENEKQIEFIEKQGFKCQSFQKLEPYKYAGDGFFWAHFTKK